MLSGNESVSNDKETLSDPGMYVEVQPDGRRDLVFPNLKRRFNGFKVHGFSVGPMDGRSVVTKSWQGTSEPIERESK